MSLKEGYQRPNQLVFKAPVKEKKSVVVNGIDLLENVPPRTENEAREELVLRGVQLIVQKTKNIFSIPLYILQMSSINISFSHVYVSICYMCESFSFRSSCGCSSGSRMNCDGWRRNWPPRTCEYASWSWSSTTWRTLAPTTSDLSAFWTGKAASFAPNSDLQQASEPSHHSFLIYHTIP